MLLRFTDFGQARASLSHSAAVNLQQTNLSGEGVGGAQSAVQRLDGWLECSIGSVEHHCIIIASASWLCFRGVHIWHAACTSVEVKGTTSPCHAANLGSPPRWSRLGEGEGLLWHVSQLSLRSSTILAVWS